MIAEDLDQVYTNFEPTRALPGVSEFYVQRPKNPLEVMRRALLRESFEPLKYLFSGHRGSGKSTELNRLMVYPDVKEKYFIAHYSVYDVLDIAGLDYTDLLFSIGAQIFIEADKQAVTMRDSLLKQLREWGSAIEQETESGRKIGVEGGLGIPLTDFFNKAQLKLRLEYESRKKIRSRIEARLSELMDIINLIVAEVELNSRKKVLVVIEDLDKTDLKTAKDLFYERQSSLTQPRCSIIYTVPIALLYSSEARQVTQAFPGEYVLPSVSITKRKTRDPNKGGRAVMKEFVRKRMSLDLIKPDALEHAITISGGVFREMARIVRDAADNAIARNVETIEKQDVERAESEIRNEFRRTLELKDYEELKKIYGSQELRGSDVCAKLLHNLSILEYRNKKNWYDIHPVIIPLLEERRA